MGTLLRTWPIFAIGMFAAAYVLWQFSNIIMEAYRLHTIQRLLRMSAVVAILLVFVPYKAGDLGRTAHNVLALMLALSIVSASCVVARRKRLIFVWLFVCLQIIGLGMCMYCFAYLLHTPSVLWGLFEPLFFLGTGGIVVTVLRSYR